MSYARFGWDNSDVYVYLDCGGYLTCCACGRWASPWPKFYSTDDMVAHLREHQSKGDVVPDDTFVELEADRAENDAWIASKAAGVSP